MGRKNLGPKLVWVSKRSMYYIRWSENGRSKELTTGTRDRAAAEEALSEFLQERRREKGKYFRPEEFLITEALDDYLIEKKMLPESKERASYSAIALADFWEGKTVADITERSCEAYGVHRGCSVGTLRRELSTLRAAVNYAHRERRLRETVAVYLPKEPPSRERWLTVTEAAALLRAALRIAAAREHLPLFIVIGLRTGQRKEAILGLRWSQVDLKGRRIDWREPERPETNKVRPHARIPKKLLPHLRRAYRTRGSCKYVVQRAGQRLADVKRSFAKACRMAGLTDVTPHTLRHTRATWGMQAGVTKWELAGFLGMHEETLIRVYGHHHPDFQADAADKVGPSGKRSDDDDN